MDLKVKTTVLIVDDEESIREILKYNLEREKFEVFEAADGEEAIRMCTEHRPNLILLDIMLPKKDGVAVCKEIRYKLNMKEIPILMISAKGDETDKIIGLEIGADDYITKPINIHLVRVKIQALLRRTYDYALSTDNLIFGNLKLNLSAAKLESSEKSIDLTHTELLILETLFKAKGDIAKRDSIMDHCWQSDNFIDDNTLAVNMTRLRKKLSEIGFDDLIQTKKGIGYYLKEGK